LPLNSVPVGVIGGGGGCHTIPWLPQKSLPEMVGPRYYRVRGGDAQRGDVLVEPMLGALHILVQLLAELAPSSDLAHCER